MIPTQGLADVPCSPAELLVGRRNECLADVLSKLIRSGRRAIDLLKGPHGVAHGTVGAADTGDSGHHRLGNDMRPAFPRKRGPFLGRNDTEVCARQESSHFPRMELR